MKWIRFLSFVFAFQFIACSSSQVGIVNSKDGLFNVVTINDLSLQYSVSKKSDNIQLEIRAEDPIMIARILALGLTIKFDEPINSIESINYPTGFMEIRSFKSVSALHKFWIYTNTVQIRKARMARSFRTAIVKNKKEENYWLVDSTEGFSVQMKVNNQSLLYRLKIPINDLKTSSIELAIGHIQLSSVTKQYVRLIPPFYHFEEDYLKDLTQKWKIRIMI